MKNVTDPFHLLKAHFSVAIGREMLGYIRHKMFKTLSFINFYKRASFLFQK